MSDSTGMSDSAKPEIPTRLGYQCRFPVEVLKNILSFLASDASNGLAHGGGITIVTDDLPVDDVPFRRTSILTLRAIQTTSLQIYVISTPYLYRCLMVSEDAIIKLLDMFEGVGQVHQVLFEEAPKKDDHPLDHHLYHRLRWTLSFVQEISLTISSRWSMRSGRLNHYTELCTVLKRLDLPPLWPALDKVSIRVRDRFGQKIADSDSYFSYEGAMMCAIGPTLHPTFLDIEQPDPPLNTHFRALSDGPRSSLCFMHADHVTVSNITDQGQKTPTARLSLTLGFSARCGKLGGVGSTNSSQALNERCCILGYNLRYVPSLTLIGIERGLEDLPLDIIRLHLGSTLSESECSYNCGDDVARYKIRPWNSPEQGEWDVWRSYNEHIGVHFCRSGIEGADNNDCDDSGSDAAEVKEDDYAQVTYETVQEDVERGIHAINVKASSTERRIESMAKRMSTIGKTIGSNTDSMAEIRGNQIAMMKDMAAMMSTMKEIAGKGNKGNRRSRSRRYQGKKTAKKAEKRAEEEDTGWLDE